MDYHEMLTDILAETVSLKGQGVAATYIPELAVVDPDKFGMCLHILDGGRYGVGDCDERFSIQSIAKVLAFTLALGKTGEAILERVGVEPSGNAFNSLVQLEYEKGIPRNPLINAGAIVVCDVLCSKLNDPKAELLDFVCTLAGKEIHYNEKVARSEWETGHRNYALAHFLKSFGNLHNDVDQVLDLYFYMCSIEMNCIELACTFQYYARHGELDGRQYHINQSQGRRLNALMQTCGFYDEAGEFSYKVGLPGKSGVGGGIVAIHPRQYSVAVWGPRLNKKGNSVRGMKALELLTTKLEWSIF